MKMQAILEFSETLRVHAAIFEIADNGRTEMRQMCAELMCTPGHGLERDKSILVRRRFQPRTERASSSRKAARFAFVGAAEGSESEEVPLSSHSPLLRHERKSAGTK